MLSKNNTKSVLAISALTLLSLSVASSIAISTPNHASAQVVTGQGGGNATNATTTTTMTGATNATNATNATATGASGGGGNTTNSVSIEPGSSTRTTDAFQPNPVQVSVGNTVTWTNNDAQPHTATSGENATPDGRFDSGILAPAATFEHTFTEAGEYPYFCLLHPNMVGTVSVS
ncbi:MAG TPA: plastocyanin/azurin family copper-binding protein [Nitrososphaera sp.]|nr:plastocyanin/azurin family copper-binding protein [Nitrososphaera sp.]